MEGNNPEGGMVFDTVDAKFVKVDIITPSVNLFVTVRDYVHFSDNDNKMCGDDCCYFHHGSCHLFMHDINTLEMCAEHHGRCKECVNIFGEV